MYLRTPFPNCLSPCEFNISFNWDFFHERKFVKLPCIKWNVTIISLKHCLHLGLRTAPGNTEESDVMKCPTPSKSTLIGSTKSRQKSKQIRFWDFLRNITYYSWSISLRFLNDLRFAYETELIFSKYVNIIRTLEGNVVFIRQKRQTFSKMDVQNNSVLVFISAPFSFRFAWVCVTF